MVIKFFEYNIHNNYPGWPPKSKTIINTINPHSFCVAVKDKKFKNALVNSDILIPDGIGIVKAIKFLSNKKLNRITGADMHEHLVKLANKNNLKVFYLGASNSTLDKIKKRISKEYPAVIVGSFSPEYKSEFSEKDNIILRERITNFSPDILFIGMTAPKQEKWVDSNIDEIDVSFVVSIGAVFDFYAGTVKRAPQWMINLNLEWFYRLVREPKRLWRRYLINNTKFIFYVLKKRITH
ncbi:WecB/TagA/CpsF family glycosyltransferase [Seonamhaeicola aphaedonensis]|uniref:N-acetylglucosaminyldiphosphoundecaprenol N-acetyl-beta-D-mannosaminyltransferase n=1 Tax=Seonamhaeicola aphaedonensis TaxID=1461338 RepID=A0A3D9HHH3_9FLAO|nr:WecB/TagA/CpsF family glycosyltransferase [Seonamhaeicola aphaedonensis]RED48933.1 N-acetylglucosaminyldiphosphoundecaprenol N-acetyl-beta-D-mannosaminyltransferase [Seonamhaeicola aphaedonensis]